MARSYHKRINLTNESYVGQLINIMGPPIPGRGVPRIDVFFAGNDFYLELKVVPLLLLKSRALNTFKVLP